MFSLYIEYTTDIKCLNTPNKKKKKHTLSDLTSFYLRAVRIAIKEFLIYKHQNERDFLDRVKSKDTCL